MNPHQIFLVLRARYKLIALVLFTTVAATVVVSLLLPKQYVATAALVVDVKSPDPIAGVYLPALSMPGYMATQVDVLNSARVAQKVVDMTRLGEDAQAKADWMAATGGQGKIEVWLAGRLQRGLEVRPSRESNVINVTYRARDAASAAKFANAFAQAYIDTSIELRVEPAKQYARWFEAQGKLLRENVEQAQRRLAEYQRSKGIIVSDDRLDMESARLNDLSTQLTIVQGQIADAQSKQRSGGASGTLPEVAQNSLITSLKVDIARLEAKLQDASGNLGKNHPQYQRMESELTELKRRLGLETQSIASGFSASGTAGRGKEAALIAAIERQKRRVLDMRRDRGEVDVLQREVEAARRALEAVTQRYSQASLESQTTQANVVMLSAAAEPIRHATPRRTLNVLASLLLGTLLGIGSALLLEFLDRRVRSADDLSELPDLPLLGTIPRMAAAR